MPYADPKKKNEWRARWRANNPEKNREMGHKDYLRNREINLQRHLERAKERNRRYREKHAAALKLRAQENRAKTNADAARNRRLREIENPEKYRALAREKMRKLRQNPEFRVLCNLRVRVYHALTFGKGSRAARTVELLGCSIAKLKVYLGALFKDGMSWENYGPVWHIDHIKPCAKFDLTDPAQQRECFHFSNLQPLFAEENLRKGDRYGDCK